MALNALDHLPVKLMVLAVVEAQDADFSCGNGG
jgi:hypothetical protein